MEEKRNIIFIGHASPEDDDFTIWLASRLQLLGYEVWIDKEQLLGGEKFWQDIDLIIRNKASKYLLVYSKNICQKDENYNSIPGKLKDGISKEFNLADSIAKQNKLNDFILLLNLDGSDFNLFIDAPRLNQIPFLSNWADGLNQLIKKLHKDNVPTTNEINDPNFGSWYQNKYLLVGNVEEKRELYHSNWWEIRLPECFYIYKLNNETQAREIIHQNNVFPMARVGNVLTSFENYSKFQIIYQGDPLDIAPEGIFKITTKDVLLGFDSEQYPGHKDCENNLKYLLNRVFFLLMKNRDLSIYEMANKKYAYYYTLGNLPSSKVQFSYPYRPSKSKNKYRWKNLIGDYVTLGKWHYAISSKVILSPIVAFSLKGHITFTSDGYNLWQYPDGEINKEKIHSNRRKKGRLFFNEEWRDLMLAFLYGLRKNGKIELPLSSDYVLEMSQYPVNFWSEFGYLDPRGADRQGILLENNFEYENTEDNLDD